jgi:hypothetical protein
VTQQIINVGTAPNNGTGDPARTAFQKCNDNFTELYAGGSGVTSIIAGTGISVDQSTGDVTVTATGGGGGVTGPGSSVDQSLAIYTTTGGDTLGDAANIILSNDGYALVINGIRAGSPVGNQYNNTVFGAGALVVNVNGIQNTAFGANALASVANASANVAIGSDCASAISEGSNNIAIGDSALKEKVVGNGSIAIGSNALFHDTDGGNIGVGTNCSIQMAGAYSNVAMGHNCLQACVTGSGNVVIGQDAGYSLTGGSYNVGIGGSVSFSSTTANTQVVIGYGLTAKGDNTAFIGGSSGAYNQKNVTTWEVTSDERIKKNIVDSPVGLAAIKQIQVRNFNYKTDEEMPKGQDGNPIASGFDSSKKVTGAVAQELQKVMPDCVTENSTSLLSVNIDPLIWALVNAVKELSAEVELLKGNINAR